MASPSVKQRAVTLAREGLDEGVIGAILGVSSSDVHRLLFDADPSDIAIAEPEDLVRACFEDSHFVQVAAGAQQHVEWPGPYVNTFEAVNDHAFAVPDNRAVLAFLNAGLSYSGGPPASGILTVLVRLANDDQGTNSNMSLAVEFGDLTASQVIYPRSRPLWSPVDYDHEAAPDGNYWYVTIVNDLVGATADVALDLFVVELPVSPY